MILDVNACHEIRSRCDGAFAATAAPVVTMTPERAPRSEKYVKMAKEAAVRVVPPLIVAGVVAADLGTDLPARRLDACRRPRASSRTPGN